MSAYSDSRELIETAADHLAPKRRGTRSEDIHAMPTKIGNETVAFNSMPLYIVSHIRFGSSCKLESAGNEIPANGVWVRILAMSGILLPMTYKPNVGIPINRPITV